MNCPKCGAVIEDYTQPCSNCGKKMTEREIKIEKMLSKKRNEKNAKGNFFKEVGCAVRDFWLKIFDVHTLSTPKDFWYAFIINMMLAVGLVLIYHWIGIVFLACIFVPLISCMMRRIRDCGKDWHYLLLVLLPGAGMVVLFVLLSLPSYYKVNVEKDKTRSK